MHTRSALIDALTSSSNAGVGYFKSSFERTSELPDLLVRLKNWDIIMLVHTSSVPLKFLACFYELDLDLSQGILLSSIVVCRACSHVVYCPAKVYSMPTARVDLTSGES